MPRLPVDGKKVVEHRITFGTKERDMIEGALAAFQFNRVASPLVAGMSDVSFMVVLGTLLGYIFPKIVIPTGAMGIEEVMEAIDTGIKESLQNRLEQRQEFNELQNEAVMQAGQSIFNVIRGLLSRGAQSVI